MLFCSYQYLYFFCVVFALYWATPWPRVRVGLLLAASIYFYASWNEWLAALICVSCVIDYFIALGLEAWTSPSRRKLLLTVSLVGNLGLLCYFKYVNFFLESIEQGVRAVGGDVSMPLLSVILPVGISFYTFEAINYTVDVYRRRAPAERNLAHFMLFITFFPHLVAGPIVRARDFLPQIRRPKRWDWARFNLGASWFLVGLLKKLAIADRMAQFADPVFADPGQYGSGAVWIATLAYALQIYCDFSGYTDMAIGSAHMFGYKLALNFNLPYLSSNIAEFWRRWHISLSSWLRDYLFIPLGGSRGNRWLTARNLFLTMTLGGLWHGASWTFVIWGALHGGLLIGHRAFRSLAERLPWLTRALESVPGQMLCVALTFLCVSLTWIFFRATTFKLAVKMVKALVVPTAGLEAPLPLQVFWLPVAAVVLCHLLSRHRFWDKVMAGLPEPVLGTGYAAMLTLALLLAPGAGKSFIYFQF